MESDLPSTLDGDTIYGVNEDGEIAMLYVGGLPFYGGGLPAGVPQISMPRPNTVINLGTLNGQSGATGTVRIKGKSLSANSTVVVSVGSGFSLSYGQQTGSSVNIDAADAMLGVDVVVIASAYGTEGTMTIESQTDSILNSYDLTSDVLENLTAIKFTKQQYIVTDIYPGVNSRLEFDMKFDGVGASSVDSNTLSRNFFKCDKHTNGTNVWAMNTNTGAPRKINYYMNLGSAGAVNYAQDYDVDVNSARSTLVWDNATDKVTFLNTDTTVDHKTVTMDTPMYVGGDPTGKPYGQFDLIIYGIKHYESDVLAHDYTPVRLNGVVGLWDAVSKQFIHSTSGTEVVAVEL